MSFAHWDWKSISSQCKSYIRVPWTRPTRRLRVYRARGSANRSRGGDSRPRKVRSYETRENVSLRDLSRYDLVADVGISRWRDFEKSNWIDFYRARRSPAVAVPTYLRTYDDEGRRCVDVRHGHHRPRT